MDQILLDSRTQALHHCIGLPLSFPTLVFISTHLDGLSERFLRAVMSLQGTDILASFGTAFSTHDPWAKNWRLHRTAYSCAHWRLCYHLQGEI